MGEGKLLGASPTGCTRCKAALNEQAEYYRHIWQTYSMKGIAFWYYCVPCAEVEMAEASGLKYVY